MDKAVGTIKRVTLMKAVMRTIKNLVKVFINGTMVPVIVACLSTTTDMVMER
jgi:hypothetical protein